MRILNSLQRADLGSRPVTLFLLFLAMACLPGIETPCACARTQAAEDTSRTLTFSERVAYQYAIEEVYWRHRTWPQDNPGPKPALDSIVSRNRIEQKVQGYLRKSRTVADQRRTPIIASELQAEMDRMASHSRQPGILRELFEALGNDPFVIAECLARPILADRFVREFKDGSSTPLLGDGNNREENALYKFPAISVPTDCADDNWTGTTTANVPDARDWHTAVWTGSEMIIWGGGLPLFNTGARYDPATDSWTSTNAVNGPSARWLHTAVWTGTEMIVWGGGGASNVLNTGGRYNPATDSWIVTNTVNAPVPRAQHSAVWTGSEMIVWGGYDSTTRFNSGGRYNPATDSWTATSTLNAPERRFYHTAVWTGREMIVWGGTNTTISLNTGGKYNPTTDSWMLSSTANAPLGRFAHTSIWSGTEMNVWGGIDATPNNFNTGGRYNPTADSWTAISTLNAPSARDSHTAVWTGNEMIIWGGVCCNPGFDFDTGGRYNPGTDTWIPTSVTNAPHARDTHTAVWTGNKMIIWAGGYYIPGSFIYLNTGGIYCAEPSTQLQSVVSRKSNFAGDFDLNLPLTGTPAIECRNGGTTNDYTIVLTFNANISVTGNPQAAVTSGIAIIGSNGVSNGGRAIVVGNVVTIPLTSVANAQTIQVTLYGLYGSTNLVIPMRILIGDTNGNGTVNASDVGQVKSRVGQQINATNFRSDLNANGYIDAADISMVKSSLGTGLP